MRRAGIAAAVAVLVLLAAAPAGASIHGYPHFDGTCSIQGTATFAPAGGFVPQEESYAFQSGEGSTCTGRLRHGVTFSRTGTFAVSATAGNSGLISCAGSALEGTTSGDGNASVQFLNPDGTPITTGGHPLRLDLRLDTYSVGNQVVLVITGGKPPRYEANTMATGRAEFAADQATLEQCAAQQVTELPFTATIETGPSRRNGGTLGFTFDSVLAGLRQT